METFLMSEPKTPCCNDELHEIENIADININWANDSETELTITYECANCYKTFEVEGWLEQKQTIDWNTLKETNNG